MNDIKYCKCTIEFLQTPIPSGAKWNTGVDEHGDAIDLGRRIAHPDNTPDFVTHIWLLSDGVHAYFQCCATLPGQRHRLRALDSNDDRDWDDFAQTHGLTLVDQATFDSDMEG